jgi:gliding motility-associated-like protein
MRIRLFLFSVLFLFVAKISNAQIVGTNGFLQGTYLEIGMQGNGAYGATTGIPAGYHPHTGPLAEVYDYGHDGWTIGTPPYMGDYTYPGSPFEGWEIQYNGTARLQGYQGAGGGTGYYTAGGAAMTTSGITTYSVSPTSKFLNWSGTTSANMQMTSSTKVDIGGSAIVTNVVFKNVGATTINNVYYMRSCDPDNSETWSGFGPGGVPGPYPGDFYTYNSIVHQNEDATHRVLVSSIGSSVNYSPYTHYQIPYAYLAIGTRDCRAVGVIYSSWSLSSSVDLATVWGQTYGPAGSGAWYALGDTSDNDIAIGIVYKLGNFNPGDSTIISYAYIFNGVGRWADSGLESPGVFPDPVLSINNGPVTSYPDTFDMCTLPSGVDTFPISILYGDVNDWSWGKWTWTPGRGLSATTGTHVTCTGSFLSGPTTYTVTGTDSATGTMTSCNNIQFVFTIKPCHTCYANTPCVGDALALGRSGDTVGASYYWWGPAGFTSTQHSPFRYPTYWYDTGIYYCVKTVAGLHDTDYVWVNFHPLPSITATSNIPHQCDPFVTPLNLTATLDTAGETFWWTGPKGYATNIQNPVINPFDSSQSGMYVVTGTTVYGCHSTDSTFVWPRPMPQIYTKISYGCVVDTVQFFNYTYNANTYHWIFGDPSPDEFVRAPIHYYRANNDTFWVHINQGNALCLTPDSVFVDLRHSIHASFHPMPDSVCFDAGVPIYFADSSYANDSTHQKSAAAPYLPPYYPSGWLWNFGDGSPLETIDSPHHVFNKPGVYLVKLTAYDAMGCPNDTTNPAFVLKINISSFHDTLLCVSQPLALQNDVTAIPAISGTNSPWAFKYSWNESAPNLDDTTVQIPNLTGVGYFTDVLTVTVPGVFPDGCPAVDTMHINSVLGKKLENLTVSATIAFGSSIQLNAGNEVVYYWLPNDGSLNNPNISNPIATPQKTTIYTVYGLDGNGCRDSADIIIYLDTTMTQDIPSGFTPNGDGINDVFKPVGIKFQNMVEFRVFNRWGQELFYTNNKEVGWDGTFHGEKQDLGVYNYLIVVSRPGQTNIVYKGNVTLLR